MHCFFKGPSFFGIRQRTSAGYKTVKRRSFETACGVLQARDIDVVKTYHTQEVDIKFKNNARAKLFRNWNTYINRKLGVCTI